MIEDKNIKKTKKSPNRVWIVQTSGIILSISLILLGVLRDEHRSVLTKAINICLECIGIG